MAMLKDLLVTPLGVMLISLGTIDAVQAVTIDGETEPLGDGFIRSFVEFDDAGNPSEIGIIFTQGALSLPTGDAQSDIALELSLPSEASITGFNHVDVTYRPRGYPGFPPIFEVPRFSLDFFLLSSQEQDLICPNPDTTGPIPTCVGDELAQALKTPEPGSVPEDFVTDSFGQAGFGTRYFDLSILTDPLTSLYEYGFYEGKMSSVDIIVTKSFLETQSNITIPIKQPNLYSKTGYYPTSYSVTYDEASQEYRTSLTGLTLRSSTPASVPELSSIWSLLNFGVWGAAFRLKSKFKKQITYRHSDHTNDYLS
jgi:hypothetical protein